MGAAATFSPVPGVLGKKLPLQSPPLFEEEQPSSVHRHCPHLPHRNSGVRSPLFLSAPSLFLFLIFSSFLPSSRIGALDQAVKVGVSLLRSCFLNLCPPLGNRRFLLSASLLAVSFSLLSLFLLLLLEEYLTTLPIFPLQVEKMLC